MGHKLALAAFAFGLPLATAGEIDYVYLSGFEAAVDCSADLSCTQPVAGKSCVSGRITDAGSGLPLRAFIDAQLQCGGGAIGGACGLSLTAHDAVAFANNPSSSAPLASTETIVDGCGRFRFSHLNAPGAGYVAIVAADAPGSELYAVAATVRPLGTNQVIDDLQAFAVRNATDEQWTQSAGSPFAENSFSQEGAILVEFGAGGAPVAGVTVMRDGNTVVNQDYYFSDASPQQKLNVDSGLTTTGANGSALIAPGASGTHTGMGGEPAECTWPSVLGMSSPGAVFFIRIDC